MFSLICAWTNGLENNREAGDLRRHRAHYDVSVINEFVDMITSVSEAGINYIPQCLWDGITCPCHGCLICGTHHYCDVIMGTVASQITSLMIVYSTVCSDADFPAQMASNAVECFHLMTSSWYPSYIPNIYFVLHEYTRLSKRWQIISQELCIRIVLCYARLMINLSVVHDMIAPISANNLEKNMKNMGKSMVRMEWIDTLLT